MVDMAYWSAWVFSHWREMGELLMLATIALQAVRGHKWLTLLTLVAQLTYKAAKLADLDENGKRTWVAQNVYDAIDDYPWVKKLITEKNVETAVNWLWAKLEEEAAKPAEGGT